MPYIKRRATGFLILTGAALFFLLTILILLMTRPARASTPSPQAYTCEDVHRLIAEKGKVAAIALAVEQGLSIRQILLIRRTCRV